jgi:hypothetical protein
VLDTVKAQEAVVAEAQKAAAVAAEALSAARLLLREQQVRSRGHCLV